MQVQIRPGERERLEEYMEVLRESALYDHYFANDENILRETLRAGLEQGQMLFAETSRGEAAGLMLCDWTGMFGMFPYLALLGVRKNFRGMGVGHALLETYERIGRQLGARNLFLCVSAFNPRARKLYQSLGYRRIALIPDFSVDGIDENVLMKRL